MRATIRRAAAGGCITPEEAAELPGRLRARRSPPGTGSAEAGGRSWPRSSRQLEAFARTRAAHRLADAGALPPARASTPRGGRPTRFRRRRWRRRRKRPCAGGAGLGGARVVRDGVVFQWYSGQGLQIQQLGTAGRANGIVKACIEANPRLACDHAKVRRVMDALLGLAVERGGFRAWEYYFAFGGGRPPWISGLAQGTMMQALEPRDDRARRPEVPRDGAGGARRLPAPLAGRRPRPDERRRRPLPHLLVQPGAAGAQRVPAVARRPVRLRGGGGRRHRAAAVPPGRPPGARARSRGADTGAWSRYSAGGAESDLGYHRLVRDFLRSLCERTKTATYCGDRRPLHALPARVRQGRVPAAAAVLAVEDLLRDLRVTRNGATVFRDDPRAAARRPRARLVAAAQGHLPRRGRGARPDEPQHEGRDHGQGGRRQWRASPSSGRAASAGSSRARCRARARR